MTNCAFNKSGDKFITGSYDRTCKVWDTNSGEELLTLEGHKNVVYAIAFNNPYGDKIITGSFDKTCKLWSAETGVLFHTFRGHATEIVRIFFNYWKLFFLYSPFFNCLLDVSHCFLYLSCDP